MDTKDILVDNDSKWKTVKQLREPFPQLYVVLSLAFIVETINPTHAPTLKHIKDTQ